jgi:hypothetical protein
MPIIPPPQGKFRLQQMHPTTRRISMSTIKQNPAAVTDYIEAMNGADYDAVTRLCADDARLEGRDGGRPIAEVIAALRARSNDNRTSLEIQAMSAEGDFVAVRYIERGVWRGALPGYESFNGMPFERMVMDWFQLRDNRITNRWGLSDTAFRKGESLGN